MRQYKFIKIYLQSFMFFCISSFHFDRQKQLNYVTVLDDIEKFRNNDENI